MTTFYFCRHGQTLNNKYNQLSGWVDTPLTDDGIQNALTAASKLHGIHFDKIISSDLGRAFITAYIIAQKIGHSLEIERMKDLREVNYGDLGNQPFSAYPSLSALENANYIAPNGESLTQMQKRVMECLVDIARKNPTKTVLIVAHGGTINSVRSAFSNKNIGLIDSEYENPHEMVAKFTIENDIVTNFEDW